jgi:hypothetical protein
MSADIAAERVVVGSSAEIVDINALPACYLFRLPQQMAEKLLAEMASANPSAALTFPTDAQRKAHLRVGDAEFELDAAKERGNTCLLYSARPCEADDAELDDDEETAAFVDESDGVLAHYTVVHSIAGRFAGRAATRSSSAVAASAAADEPLPALPAVARTTSALPTAAASRFLNPVTRSVIPGAADAVLAPAPVSSSVAVHSRASTGAAAAAAPLRAKRRPPPLEGEVPADAEADSAAGPGPNRVHIPAERRGQVLAQMQQKQPPRPQPAPAVTNAAALSTSSSASPPSTVTAPAAAAVVAAAKPAAARAPASASAESAATAAASTSGDIGTGGGTGGPITKRARLYDAATEAGAAADCAGVASLLVSVEARLRVPPPAPHGAWAAAIAAARATGADADAAAWAREEIRVRASALEALTAWLATAQGVYEKYRKQALSSAGSAYAAALRERVATDFDVRQPLVARARRIVKTIALQLRDAAESGVKT